jgi:hypothetical protein
LFFGWRLTFAIPTIDTALGLILDRVCCAEHIFSAIVLVGRTGIHGSIVVLFSSQVGCSKLTRLFRFYCVSGGFVVAVLLKH